MKSGKIKDLICATSNEVTSTFLESDVISDFFSIAGETFVSECVAGLIGEIAGSAIPGINGIRLSYKQKRFERNVKNALDSFAVRLDALESNFSCLEDKIKELFRTKYLEWLLDNLQEEKQIEKVPCYVNGYIALMTNEINDNLMLLFFNTISELTQLDIDVLKMYDSNSDENIYSLCDRYSLEPEQTMMIKDKLARLGLLQNRNDEYRDLNIDLVVEHLLKEEQESKKTKPKPVSFPKSKIKKIQRAETFFITSLGRAYLGMIS